jgi:FtsP/CotA-like multicopper oxidase with cupredoxin domain
MRVYDTGRSTLLAVDRQTGVSRGMIAAFSLALLSLRIVALPAPHSCAHLPAATAPQAASNDNRLVAGSLRDGVLSLRIVATLAAWHPEGKQGCALQVHAFAEEGKPAQIPGPLIRVRSGTEVRVVVRNALGKTLWMRGLQEHNVAALDSVAIAPGASSEFRFRPSAPGAWYYWGGDANAAVPKSGVDGQLVGALIVDSPNERPADRVFVMTRWTPNGLPGNGGYQLNAMNGLSWPHTERLTQTVGDSVRWHVINAADDFHMMHLHGFYFRLETHGNAARDTVTLSPTKTMVVTNVVRAGEWITLTWSPERAGNWLFHCHIVAHMSPDQQLGRMPCAVPTTAAASSSHANHALESMAGLILGVTVRPNGRGAAVADPRPRRALRLFANAREHVFAQQPGFAFVLQEGDAAPARDSIRIPGTPLVLKRGEPVEITVFNRLARPLAIHWHGIELESYFDGVAGWSGTAARVAPAIAPNDSFVVRFTPPRAGTFIYHVHNEHGEELASGLYGALIVLEPGVTYDPTSDLTLVIGTAGPGLLRPSFVNGSATPDTLELVAGKTYRLRLIDINANDAHRTALVGPAGPVPWRLVARDGRELPPNEAVSQQATASAAGVTRDLEFSLPRGTYSITVADRAAGSATGHVTTVPIRVQ